MKHLSILITILILAHPLAAQDDLLNLLDDAEDQTTEYVSATFKGTRLINGHSAETRKKGTLDFMISHRFGEISGGAYEFFGLDQSNIRLGLEYGITDRLYVGFARNSFEKTFDGFGKYRLIRQSSGVKKIPVSVTLFSSVAIKTLRILDEEPTFSDKLVYTSQLLIARKISSSVSLQLMPSYVHFNTIQEDDLNNDVIALGVGGRVKLSQRISLNAEYYYQFTELRAGTFNSIAIGVDIETGGHVFQLHFTNSTSMIEKGFIAETTNDFFDGDIHFGFNISRSFQLAGK